MHGGQSQRWLGSCRTLVPSIVSTQHLLTGLSIRSLATARRKHKKRLHERHASIPVSKMLAHVAATEYVEKNKVQYDLIRIMPGYMQGANELYQSAEDMRDPKTLGSNQGTMWTALGNAAGGARPCHQVFLDDVAKAHVLALKPEVAKHGDNLLMAANDGVGIPWDEFVPVIKRLYPDAVEKGILKPKMEDQNYIERYDVSAAEKALGFKFAGPEEMVKSVVGQYVNLVGET